jgi:acetyl esterase/lipase
MRLLIMLLTGLSLTPLSVCAQTTAGTANNRDRSAKASVAVPRPTFADRAYGEHERQVLDFWQAKTDKPAPLAFVIHGGGWQGGDKNRVGRFVNVAQLLEHGISVAAINYRFVSHARADGVSPPVRLPLHDAALALQFLRSQSEHLRIDPTRIGAARGSAGACSSLWLAFHPDLADPAATDPVRRQSTRLQCAAVTGAQTTLDPQQMQEWTPNSRYGGHAFGLTGFASFLAARDRIQPLIAEYSPWHLVSSDDPAVYLIYSAAPALGQPQKDPTHTANFGVKLQERCESQSVHCELVYPGAENVHHATPTDFLISQLQGTATSQR